MANPLGPWQPRAVAKMVANGCDEQRAKRIAAAVESQVRLSVEDHRVLALAIGLETDDAE